MKQFLILFLVFSFSLKAQVQISGIVVDHQTKKPLSFATIHINSTKKTIADVQGKFSVSVEENLNSISVSYVSFETKVIVIDEQKKFYLIQLEHVIDKLQETEIKNQNVAIQIIKKTIENKTYNNPEEKLKNFQFKTYNKLIVTANPDSISGKIDTVFIKKRYGKQIVKLDSTQYKFKKIVSKQHLFQTEKVSQFQFSTHKLKETIIGTKMSGFKQPIFEVLGFNLQSFSVYDNQYELFETKYTSPIATNAISNYDYKLLDTISVNNRKTVLIYFKNKNKSSQSGLEGALYIDINNYAIANAVLRTRGVLDISGTHDFEYIQNQDIWFPISTTFKIIKGKNDEDIKIFGGTIQFDGDVEKDFKPRKKQASDFVYLISEAKNFDIEYNIPIKIKKAYVAIEIKEDAINKSNDFWNLYRKDSLDTRSQKTYLSLDSISIKNKLENRIFFGRKIINGFVPVSFMDFDLRKFFNYNNYEGFRFCIAGVTSERFSKKYRIENYIAYGTKDGNFKYNLGFSTRIGKFSNSWIGVSYTDDIQEIASTVFEVDKKQFKLFDTSLLNFSSFYNYVSWKVYLSTKIIPKTESIWEFSHTIVDPKFDYLYRKNQRLYQFYNMTTAMVSLQWNPFSSFMQTPLGRIEIDKRYPKFTFQFTKSLPGILDNDFNFGKIDFRTEYEKKYLNGQKTDFIFALGYAFGDVPLTHLYNNSPNSLNKDKLLQRTTIEGENDFETMYFNEFFSSEFAFFQFKHNFGRITLLKKIKPSLVFVTRIAFGNIKNPEQHVGIDYKTLKNGYFESGIELNEIFKGFGISTFYRYGANKLPGFEDNLALRISYNLNLGF